jgi:tRNA dimethylallyltransferase
LRRERKDLVARIERRIDEQIAAGWLDEVRRLEAIGATAMQAAGYRELAAHLRRELTLAEAVTLTKARTRQLAKRQMTWFRHEPGVRWITVAADEPPRRTTERILEELTTR